MPKKAKMKMPKGKGFWNIKQPESQSPRNLDIFRLVMVDGMKQKAVAEKYGIKQPRVSQIVRDVKRFIAVARPFGGEDWHPDEQISYTNQINKLRLEKQYEESVAAYSVSKLPMEAVKMKVYYDIDDEKKDIPRRKVEDISRKFMPQGDVRLLQQQLRLCDKMRQIDLSQATLPKAKVELFPDIDGKRLTWQERKDLFQKLLVRWYDMQQRLESQQTGRPAKQWPIEEYIDIDGESVQKKFEQREQALKDRELDMTSREFDLQCLQKQLKQQQEYLDQHSAWLRIREDKLATQSGPQSSPTQSSPSLRNAVPATESRATLADRATESRATLNSQKRPYKNDYVQNNYPPESVTSVYFPTRADELAYLNKGLYSEGDISHDISPTTQSSPSLRDGDRATESRAALEQRAKTRAAILQHMRDMQFKHTFYDKDGNVTDVCPWETKGKRATERRSEGEKE